MTEEELSDDEVLELLEQPSRTATKPRSQKGDEDRTIKNWFSHQSQMRRDPCQVPEHDRAPEKRGARPGLTLLINGVRVCRECYLSGLDKANGESV